MASGLEAAKARARSSIMARTTAAVSRASRERLNRHYGRHVHPMATTASKDQRNATLHAFATNPVRALRMTAKSAGKHGNPLGRISTPRVASLISGFLGGPVPPANLRALTRASSAQGYHGPFTSKEAAVPIFRERGSRMTAKRTGAKSANRAKAKTVSKGKARAKSA